VVVAGDTTAPAVTLTAPAAGASLTGSVTLTATATDNVGVTRLDYLLDGTVVGTFAPAVFTFTWNSTTATNGAHALSARAYDAAGNRTTSAAVSVTVANDTTPPTVSITAPTAASTVAGTVSITATAADNVGVLGVQFKLDGANLGAEVTAAPYTVPWTTSTASNGAHTLTAVARDAAGNRTTSAAITVTVANDTTPPTVSITAPAAGTTVTGMVSITAAAADDIGVVGVQFQLDGINLGAEVTAAPYTVPWTTSTASNGAHTLTAVARDAAGNRTTSAPVNVTVATATSSSPGVPTRSPYKGSAFSVPGLIEAEDFDNGGEGVAYHDLTAGNQGGQYRTGVDVDIITPAPGVYVVNNFQNGEWLSYTINVTQTAVYRLEALVSSMFTTSSWHMELDGVNVTGAVLVPNTGGWATFQWVGVSGVALTAGQHILTLVADQQYFNVDAIRITVVAPARSPYRGSAFSVPGLIEAEDFDNGGEGVAYHDLTAGNQGGQYRTGVDVDIITPAPGVYVVNNFQNGEWLSYTINVTQSATYRVEALVSSTFTTSSWHMELDGVNVTGAVLVPNTGGWAIFQWVGVSGVALTAGPHVLTLVADQQYFNVDAIRVSP
jgi:hypothetical protein